MEAFKINSISGDHNNCDAIGQKIAAGQACSDGNTSYNQTCAAPSRITARAFGTVSVEMPLDDAKRLLAMSEQSVRVSRALEQYTPDVALLETLNRTLRRELN